jgi:NAD(P)-dependent dehydrogenase (short-subunit alcohol dehydrogenase family)
VRGRVSARRANPPAECGEFAVNWETDVKIALHLSTTALSQPLPAGSSVILISSGAALAASPNSRGYAGAKLAQIFIANYSQKESDRLGLSTEAQTPHGIFNTDHQIRARILSWRSYDARAGGHS